MLLNGKQVRPLPGHAFILLESLLKNTSGIEIPTRFMEAPHFIGTVEAHNCTEKNKQRFGKHRLEIGDCVIVKPESGRIIQDNLYDYNIESILAIVIGILEMKPIFDQIPRCKWCGNARTGVDQGMITFNGRCPRCGKNAYGEYIPPNPPVTVTDAEIEQHHDAIYRKNPNRQKKIFSFGK